MRFLKPGDPCPCYGRPLPERLPTETVVYLSWLALGQQLHEATKELEKSE